MCRCLCISSLSCSILFSIPSSPVSPFSFSREIVLDWSSDSQQEPASESPKGPVKPHFAISHSQSFWCSRFGVGSKIVPFWQQQWCFIWGSHFENYWSGEWKRVILAVSEGLLWDCERLRVTNSEYYLTRVVWCLMCITGTEGATDEVKTPSPGVTADSLKKGHEAEWLKVSLLEDLHPCNRKMLPEALLEQKVTFSHTCCQTHCWTGACVPRCLLSRLLGVDLACSSLPRLICIVCRLYAINWVIHKLFIGYCFIYFWSHDSYLPYCWAQCQTRSSRVSYT